jgi:hypothetical protein
MGWSRIYRVGSPYNGVELAEMDYAQTADVVYLAHLDHPVTKLLRYGHTDWAFATVTFGAGLAAPGGVSATPTTPNVTGIQREDATYVVTALNDVTGQESLPSAVATANNDLTLNGNYNTITWSAVTGATLYRVYKSETTGDYGLIATTSALTAVDRRIGPAYDQGPPVGATPFPAAGDYPSTVALFEQRLLLARTNSHPNAIYASRSGAFENFDTSRPLRDDDAITIGVVAGKVCSINQLVSTKTLLALTSDAIFKVDGATEGGYLTATQTRALRQIGRGSSRLKPIVVDNVTFYQPGEGSSIRSLGYSFQEDGYTATDVTIYSPHLFRGFSIVSWAYLQEPDSIIVAVRSDGSLLAFTFEQEQQVWGWTRWETDGRVENVCAITENGEDRLYLTVWRTVGGVDRLYIERMGSALWNDVTTSCYLDCAVSYNLEDPDTEFAGLNHLEGRTVDALADGGIVRGLVVTGGKITLPDNVGPVSRLTVGLPYSLEIDTLPLIIAGGVNVARRHTLGEAVVKLLNAADVYAGPAPDKVRRLKSRSVEAYGDADILMNGDYLFDSEPHTSGELVLSIRQNAPLPCTVVGVFLDAVVGG